MDYAIYLVKRTLRKRQKYGLEEYEQSALHRLQNMLAHKWEFICMQAADQVRLYKDKRKSDQIVLEAQVGSTQIDLFTNRNVRFGEFTNPHQVNFAASRNACPETVG